MGCTFDGSDIHEMERPMAEFQFAPSDDAPVEYRIAYALETPVRAQMAQANALEELAERVAKATDSLALIAHKIP